MTLEEAITELCIIQNVYVGMRKEYQPCVEALQIAIEALKAEQTEPNCETCIHYGVEFLEDDSIDTCLANECHYKPKQTEPQTNPFAPPYDNCKSCKWWNDIIGGFGECFVDECEYEPKDEPQTDCAWK